MGTCRICQKKSSLISRELGLCLDCIRWQPEEACEIGLAVHARIRCEWGLPAEAPRHTEGIACDLCVNSCHLGEGGWGFCGLRKNALGKVEGVSATKGKLSWYHDPLPTNCVGDWVCPGGSGCGYPAYSYSEGAEHGYNNLAVFPHACTFHCLFCQNWHFRYHTFDDRYEPIESLVRAVNKRTACICYFGGDPSPQLPYLLHASRMVRERNEGRILRICWETNGAMSKRLIEDVADSALVSGGCIKFDLKAWNETLHMALTGVTNRRTLENFARLAKRIPSRPEPPLLIASTLMVPGYIDAIEVGRIAEFIESVNPEIPYSLLAFHPEYKMTDLPATSQKQAQECLDAASQAGLRRVRVGNTHLLW
ncbi:MAG: radical SAM protein [Desulfobacteraceae bacterium]|nr:radical SAM protein [Desulfobacteraceae bacterium]